MSICKCYVDKTTSKKINDIYSKSHCSKKVLGYEKINDAIIYPHVKNNSNKDYPPNGYIKRPNGTIVESSLLHENYSFKKNIYEGKNTSFNKKTCIFIGSLICIYGHAITDNIKKIWWLKTKRAQELLEHGAIITFTTFPMVQILPHYIKEIFSLAELNLDNFLWIKEPTRFNTLYIPDNSLFLYKGERWYTSEFCETIERIKSTSSKLQAATKIKHFDKLYFSRSHLKNNKDIGENIIEKEFQKRGYQIIYPEQHCVSEQIEMLSSCSSFAATEGSISHNSMFTNPQTKVTIIRKANFINSYQVICNELAKSDVIYVDANKSITRIVPWTGPFYLCKTKHLASYLGDNRRQNIWFDRLWWKYLVSYGKWKLLKILSVIKTKCEL